MQFLVPEILKEENVYENDPAYQILLDRDDCLLVSHKISDSELIYHNVLYRRFPSGMFQKMSVIADISKDWDFQVTEQNYKVLDDRFGLVEWERGIYSVTYDKNDLNNVFAFPLSNNVFSILEMIESQKIPAISRTNEAYFRELGDYGVDVIICDTGEKFGLSSLQPHLDKVVFEKRQQNKVM